MFHIMDTMLWEPSEICDNATDDDDDGLIDINDPDCECPILQPVSRIPNPSFEAQNCCPSNRSQLNCADTWIQASAPTTDYLHTCGWMGWEEFPPPLPFPDGMAAVGFRDGRYIRGESEPNWKEYAGACLLAPLEEGVAYRFQFHIGFSGPISSPPINVAFFGNTDCNNLPFGVGNETLGCPTNDTTNWIKLGSVRVAGNNNWVETAINVVPETDIYAIAIGPDCVERNPGNSTYYFFDNLILDEQRAFDFQIQPLTHPCSENFGLEVPDLSNTAYQWYREGAALIGETGPTLKAITEEGNYQVRIQNESNCKITRAYVHRVPSHFTRLNEYICLGEEYPFGNTAITEPGTYTANFRTADNCDSLVELSLAVISYEPARVRAKIFEGDLYQLGNIKVREAGFHELALPSSLGCDSLILLQLDYHKVFIPNAFSPNGDGYNDIFTVFGGADLEEVKSLRIFSRWGELIYDGQALPPGDYARGWNGEFRGETLPAGLYTYVAEVRMADGQEKAFSGEVELVR